MKCQECATFNFLSFFFIFTSSCIYFRL